MDSELTKEEFEAKAAFYTAAGTLYRGSSCKDAGGTWESDVRVPMRRRLLRSLRRRYITKENKNLYMTELGEVVNNIMKQSFPSIVDVNFTANMEGLLDMVEEGKVALERQ